MWYVISILAVWAVLVLSLTRVRGRIVRRIASLVLPVIGVTLMFLFAGKLNTGYRLLAATFGLLYLLKAAVGLWRSCEKMTSIPWTGRLLYMSFWPGMDPQVFEGEKKQREDEGHIFRVGYLWFLVGVCGMVLMSVAGRDLPFALRSWIELFLLLVVLHFGLSDVLTATFQGFGWRVKRMFRNPLNSRSLQDFWSRRWNRPFLELSRGFLLPLFRRLGGRSVAVFGVFLVSGGLHELAISYPVGAGWGGPVVYFLIQWGLMMGESQLPRRPETGNTILRRAWTYTAVLLPLPLLFHAPFRAYVDVLYEWLHHTLLAWTPEMVFGMFLRAAAVGHLVVFIASVQVPYRFHWNEELSKLSSMNRKLFWIYGGYVAGCILSFAVFTSLFHDRMLAGEPAALGIAGFITVFWGVRLVLDRTCIGPEEWPDGPLFDIGHLLLSLLFLFFVLVYGGIVLRHWV